MTGKPRPRPTRAQVAAAAGAWAYANTAATVAHASSSNAMAGAEDDKPRFGTHKLKSTSMAANIENRGYFTVKEYLL